MKIRLLSLLALFPFLAVSPVFEAQAATQSILLSTTANVVPILELSLSESAQLELKFGSINSSGLGPVLSEVRTIQVNVLSNTGNQYILTQSLDGPLQNTGGDTIAVNNLSFRTKAVNSTGTPIPAFTPASASAQTIFSSDNQGTAENISADYQLYIPPLQAPGDYSALITYTVSSV